MLLPNRHESTNEYRYGFNGQEKDDEIKGSMKPIAQVFAQIFGFSEVKGTAGSVNYHSFFTDGTTTWSDDYMKPYPENGQWDIIKSRISGTGLPFSPPTGTIKQ